MERDHWQRQIESLDPAVDFERIYRIVFAHEFPWDMNQALSFALFRTYAVPTVGRLLDETGEFTGRTQKRYDDTALLLDAVVEHGFDSEQGRTAVRRVNQMHRSYDISDDDLRYVLCTFVVVPIRWMDDYGWRPMTETEKAASAHYYRELGRRMAIPDIPETWQEFARVQDAYETERFGFEPGARRVADATLQLLATIPPSSWLPAEAVRKGAYALMDEPLLDALAYPRPSPVLRRVVRAGLRARGRFVRRMPPRQEPFFARELPGVRGYPGGYDLAELGTFPAGCPVSRR